MTATALHALLQDIHAVSARCGRPDARLLAVSKMQPAEAIRTLAAQGQQAFGENYVQEALLKRQALSDLALEWHLIGHLQSNKAADAARAFDWIHSIDRPKLVPTLARHRPEHATPLNLLIQVNIDDEASKQGCAPADIDALAQAIAAQPRLRLRGLMAIPAPRPTPAQGRAAFRAMRALYERLAAQYAGIDTLSMGMSADYAIAIEEGATLVRVGSALFGARPRR